MKHFTKSALCIAGVAFVIGIGTCVAGLTYGAAQGGFSWNGNANLVTLVDDSDMDAFSTIDASFALGDIVIEPGDSYGLKINISEKANEVAKMEWSNKDGVLRVAPRNNNHNWSIFTNGPSINFDGVAWLGNVITGNKSDFTKQGIVITVPRDAEFDSITLDASSGAVAVLTINAQDIDINCDLGSVRLENATVGNQVTLQSGSGTVTCENVSAASIEVTSDLGSVNVIDVTSSKSAIGSDSGTVDVEDCSLGDATISTDLGSINMSNIEADTLQVDNSSGSVNADNVNALKVTGSSDLGSVTFDGCDVGDMSYDVDSGRFDYRGKLASCNIIAGLGSVSLDIEGRREDYSIKAQTSLGSIYIDGDKCGNSMNDGKDRPALEFDLDSGSLNVDFK